MGRQPLHAPWMPFLSCRYTRPSPPLMTAPKAPPGTPVYEIWSAENPPNKNGGELVCWGVPGLSRSVRFGPDANRVVQILRSESARATYMTSHEYVEKSPSTAGGSRSQATAGEP